MAFVLGLASPFRHLLRCNRKSLMSGTQGLPGPDVLLNSLCIRPASVAAVGWLLNCTSGSPVRVAFQFSSVQSLSRVRLFATP